MTTGIMSEFEGKIRQKLNGVTTMVILYNFAYMFRSKWFEDSWFPFSLVLTL